MKQIKRLTVLLAVLLIGTGLSAQSQDPGERVSSVEEKFIISNDGSFIMDWAEYYIEVRGERIVLDVNQIARFNKMFHSLNASESPVSKTELSKHLTHLPSNVNEDAAMESYFRDYPEETMIYMLYQFAKAGSASK